MNNSTRVALITGGAQGIGEAIAIRLAQDGLDVAVLDVPGKEDLLQGVADKITSNGRRALWLTGDVTREEDVKQAVERTVETLGSLDAMIANAGIVLVKSIIKMNTDEWNNILAVNSTGVMLSYKHAAVQMIKQARGGRIIGLTNLSAYCASKFAVRGLTQAVALELRAHKITVNAYAPGAVLTQMTLHPDDERHGGPGSVTSLAAGMKSGDVIFAEPDVIAGLVSYLVKPEAWFVTGQTIDINGGMYMS